MTDGLALRLLDDVLAAAPQGAGRQSAIRLSVVGLSKNAGKTVTLNHLVRAAEQRGIPLGLVSTGRDGEEQDAITELPKPRIWAPAGAWLVTAREALTAGSAKVAVFKQLPMMTPFGPMLIGRVETAGEVLLIGPGSAQRMSEALGGLEAYGARLCLVDGSFDRIAAAAPTVTGRVVLAAGAAYSYSMTETVAQVRHLLDLFDLPVALPAAGRTVETAARKAPVSIAAADGAVTALPVATGLGDPAPIVAAALSALADDPGASLVLQGALGDRLLLSLLKARAVIPLVVNDPTRILVERNLWRRWRRQGGQAYVLQPVRLLALTTNAYSPVGKGYDPHEFFAAIAAVADRPVYDLMAGLPHTST
ncbi:MAG TPA: hypothetical protein VGK74_00715 [Symbiobacteriaceae bacterium]|jgi:hypothetical protein